ncbi:hypothetical protein FRC00_013221 [Tulasnella sp. 408]|nr:hypothetical protein FRC00_013221 [Tulasnella sp. 408]
MDTPAAAPNQLVSGLESDLALQAASALPWITFGGLPTESSSAFVQSVQRIGFQQGMSKDDVWMAEYAATCFEGPALVWYAALDDEVRESWKKLRVSILVNYLPIFGEQGPPLSNAPQLAIIPSAPIGARASSASTSPHHSQFGIVELLGKHTGPRGYLSFNPTSGIEITSDKDNAVTVSFPLAKPEGQDVIQLEKLCRSSCYIFTAGLIAWLCAM